MTKRRNITVIMVTLLFLCALILSYGMKGRFTLEEYSFSSAFTTYSMERTALKVIGKNRLGVPRGGIRDTLESLPYIGKVVISVKGTVLEINAEEKDEGLIITDGERWYFYCDALSSLDSRDIYPLSKRYLVLNVESTLLSSFLTSSFGSEEVKMIDTLKSVRPDSALITKAEYDNNNSSVYSGSLRLTLSSLNASLVIKDIRDISRLDEAVSIMETEYSESSDRLSGVTTEYVLSDGMLIRMR
jgi:hypothetical protein